MRRTAGFTLVELLIVIVILAVIVTLALPNLLSARLSANETAAIGILRELITAQSQFQQRAAADEDVDGLGEYGTLAEMSGATPVRGGRILSPAVLSSAFRSVNTSGEVEGHGYQFRVWLPNASGDGLGELSGGGPPPGIDADLAETTWCAYAWPTNYETTGVRTFFVNQGGEILFTTDGAYDGPSAPLLPGAALVPGGPAASITGRVATGTVGRDGNFWLQAPN